MERVLEISKAVIQKDGKFLLLKRAAHSKSFSDMWDFAGGRHELKETAEQALIREVKEETSWDINPGKEIKKEKYRDEKHNLLFHYFTPTIISGNLILSQDHSEFTWVTKEEMKNLKLHPCVELFF